jgi:hypothetical protein
MIIDIFWTFYYFSPWVLSFNYSLIYWIQYYDNGYILIFSILVSGFQPFTLLNWILLVSRVVCERAGNLCFIESKRDSALLASITFLSSSDTSSFTIFQDDFEWWVLAFLRQTYIAASTRSANSRASCSSLVLSWLSSWSGENLSGMLIERYKDSPKVIFPLWKQKESKGSWVKSGNPVLSHLKHLAVISLKEL